jgi:hypothetical protein
MRRLPADSSNGLLSVSPRRHDPIDDLTSQIAIPVAADRKGPVEKGPVEKGPVEKGPVEISETVETIDTIDTL